MSETRVRSFFRIAKAFPPGDEEYRTMREKKGLPSPDVSDEVRRAWDTLSAYDTEEGARRQAIKRRGAFGSLIVRYDIPDGATIRAEKTFGPGHHSLRGDAEELKRYLSDFVANVYRFVPQERRTP